MHNINEKNSNNWTKKKIIWYEKKIKEGVARRVHVIKIVQIYWSHIGKGWQLLMPCIRIQFLFMHNFMAFSKN